MILAIIVVSAFVTSFISAIIGMAGGLILMGVYGMTLPVGAAFVLHGLTQMTANGYRCYLLKSHIIWKRFFLYVVGAVMALGIFLVLKYVPNKKVLFLVMGALACTSPFLGKLWFADYAKGLWPVVAGLMTNGLQMIAGVGGPILDLFFVNSNMTKKQNISNKAVTQTLAHGVKVVYFSILVWEGLAEFPEFIGPLPVALAMGSAVLGAWTGAKVMERLSERNFKIAMRTVVVLVGIVYLVKGIML